MYNHNSVPPEEHLMAQLNNYIVFKKIRKNEEKNHIL